MSPPNIKAIAFDAFGTVCQLANKKPLYRDLLKRQQSPLSKHLNRDIMCGLTRIEKDAIFDDLLQQQLDSFYLFPETLATLTALRNAGYKIGIISNLSEDYGSVLTQQFSPYVDSFSLSYLQHAMKPEPQIYQDFCQQLAVKPEDVLMIGDNFKADVEGARNFGFQAIQIIRGENKEKQTADSIQSLAEIEKYLSKL